MQLMHKATEGNVLCECGESKAMRDGSNAYRIQAYRAESTRLLRYEAMITFSFLLAGYQFTNANSLLKLHGALLENDRKCH
jgi:hypothetical protein